MRKIAWAIVALANSSAAAIVLFFWAMAEGFFFFIPPDFALIPLVIFNNQAWRKFALVTVLGSFFGSLLCYLLALVDPDYMLSFLQSIALINLPKLARVEEIIREWGPMAYLIQPFSWAPLKAFMYYAGLSRMPVLQIAVLLAAGRAVRMFLLAFIGHWVGQNFRPQIEHHIGACLIGWLLFTLLVVTLQIALP
jgi:membrane protein YqaA with SNARE-associated domain